MAFAVKLKNAIFVVWLFLENIPLINNEFHNPVLRTSVDI